MGGGNSCGGRPDYSRSDSACGAHLTVRTFGANGGTTRRIGPARVALAREEALREHPLRQPRRTGADEDPEDRQQPTIYRRMPIEVVPCDPELYVFLVRYPEIVVNMWQLMGVTKVKITRTGPYAYDTQDGAGTVSQVELVYGTREKHLFLAEGHYEGPLLAAARDGPLCLADTGRLFP